MKNKLKTGRANKLFILKFIFDNFSMVSTIFEKKNVR